MASDHRGRELHAGKRTAQERGWDFRGTDGFGPVYGVKSDGMNDMSFQEDGSGGYDWTVNKHHDSPGLKGGEYDLGSGKEMFTTRSTTQVQGRTKTPARAIIAADAMRKRIDEGRDLKTGRPNK